jgi:hypothetical protein
MQRDCDVNFGSGTRFALDFAVAKSACADGYDNFGFGRALRALNLAGAKLACAEIERVSLPATGVADG